MAFIRFIFIFEIEPVFMTIKRLQCSFQLEYNEKIHFFLNVRLDFTSFFKESRGPTEFLTLLLCYMQLV